MKLSFSKKAGLQMSINAIVVLVMAMVVLGLGLGFIRGMFSSAEDKFIGAIGNVDLTNPPTAQKPITFEKNTITVKRDSSKEFTYSVYNTAGKPLDNVTIDVLGSCTDGISTFAVDSVGAPIEDGDFVTFMGLLVAPATSVGTTPLPAGTYICTVSASGSDRASSAPVPNFASTQLTIKVTS